MNNRPWITYGLFSLLFFTLILILLMISRELQLYKEAHFNGIPLLIFNGIASPLIGMVMGILHWQEERQKEGTWRVNKAKFFIVAVPALFFGYYSFLAFGGLILQIGILHSLLVTTAAMNIFQIIFGYIFITSFYKEEEGAFR